MPATASATPLFAALRDPACYPHPVRRVEVLETHISWVLLTGEFAYKIKKPVYLGFVDFTSLGLRRHYCEEEVRLNRRLAPGLYLDVVEIRGSAQAPRVGGKGRVLDHAVRMREFPQDALAARALERRAFGTAEVDALAMLIAGFHASAAVARASERFGTPETVLADAVQNFEQMQPLVASPADDDALRALRLWTEHEFAARRGAFAARKAQGRVRECHGDLHLGNIALIDGQPIPFDCIEFSEDLRWIDVMSEAAFLAMDLHDRGRGDLAWRFLNRYLEATGDYAALGVLRYYLVYRALVRAKIHLMRSRQPPQRRNEKSRLLQEFRGYVRLAARFASPGRAALLLAHGFSGSGKTTLTQPLVERIGAIRLRSDLERKRLHGLAPLASSASAPGTGIYSRDSSDATYRKLGELADEALRAGYPVVVDAAFLRREEREAFRAIAERNRAAFLILNINAPLEVLRARIAARQQRADDASEADLAVLDLQIAAREPLAPAEMAAAISVDGTLPATPALWHPVVERLRKAPDSAKASPRRPSRG